MSSRQTGSKGHTKRAGDCTSSLETTHRPFIACRIGVYGVIWAISQHGKELVIQQGVIIRKVQVRDLADAQRKLFVLSWLCEILNDKTPVPVILLI